MKFLVKYRNDDCMSVWRYSGIYTKTDALGTASLILKNGCSVSIIPIKD